MKNDSTRVVIVDNDPDFLDSLGLLLELDGYVVQIARGADAATSLIAEFQPHCVLTDIDLLSPEGAPIAPQLRFKCRPGTLFIATAGWHEGDEAVTRKRAQYDHYIRKPVDITRLQGILSRI